MLDALAVVRGQAGGGDGVEGGEAGVQRGQPRTAASASISARNRVGLGHGREADEQPLSSMVPPTSRGRRPRAWIS